MQRTSASGLLLDGGAGLMPSRYLPIEGEPIERCAPAGVPSAASQGGVPAFGRRDYDWPPQFSRRVDDAMRELRRGDAVEDVQTRHGGVVLRQAQREMSRAGR